MRTGTGAVVRAVTVVAAVLSVAAAPVLGGGVDEHDGHAHLGEVSPGPLPAALTGDQDVYWQSPPLTCEGGCPVLEWELEVAEDVAGSLIEVAIDDRWVWDETSLTVTAPDGRTETVETFTYYVGHFLRFEEAAAGTYTVQIQPAEARDSVSRLRAMVVPDRELEGVLLPNLRSMPPFDFSFTAPFWQAGVITPSPEVGMAAAGQRLQSCTADEMLTAADPTQGSVSAPLQCLRFSTGPENVGLGHLDLRFEAPVSSDEDRLQPMTQHLHHADGSTTTRDAGTFEFHPTHGHYHHAEMAVYDLLAVDGDTLTLVSGGVKTGFCPADLGIADWESPHHAEQNEIFQIQDRGSCFALDGNGAMGISAGFLDVYHRVYPGQFVDFTLQGDGLYVVRVTMDRDDLILESDETDNVSYALIRVQGEDVEVLERGYGMDHTDPSRVVVDDGRTTRPPLELDALTTEQHRPRPS